MGRVVHRHVRRYMAKVEELTGMMSLQSFLSIAARDAISGSTSLMWTIEIIRRIMIMKSKFAYMI